jgi:hypothetical protein
MTKYWACDSNFTNAIEAGLAIGKLAAHGISTTQFVECRDILPDTVYYGIWQPAIECAEDDFIRSVLACVRNHGGADLFTLLDHTPVPSDFNYTPDEPALNLYGARPLQAMSDAEIEGLVAAWATRNRGYAS